MPQKYYVYISLSLVAITLGFLMAVQFRVSGDYNIGIPRENTQELSQELKQLKSNNKNLQAELSDLKIKLKQVNAGQAQAVQALKSELKKGRMAAGMVTVTGPGVEVILDNPKSSEHSQSNTLFIIRDQDLLKVINELRGAGAEALSINGERIIATSEVRYAGSFINVNTKRIVPPYQVLAVGDPQALEHALAIPGGLRDYLGNLGIKVKIKKHEELTVPAYFKENNFKYAKSM
ncbi:MAG: DUF881 domain-containing protein [Clostridiales bacterium]|nr:DUF881 domain-containing protein [Clostridiales bacterium]MCF8021355.1 DUF881 domain-containing protein [Clostridiales bacterium]